MRYFLIDRFDGCYFTYDGDRLRIVDCGSGMSKDVFWSLDGFVRCYSAELREVTEAEVFLLT